MSRHYKTTMTDKALIECNNTLGEGPHYDYRSGFLYWVDIKERKIQRISLPKPEGSDYSQTELQNIRASYVSFTVPDPVGVLGLTECPGVFIAGAQYGVGIVDLRGNPDDAVEIDYLAKFESPEDPKDMRANDGGIDPNGNFWVGTMRMFGKPVAPCGRVYRLERDMTLTTVLEGLSIPNTVAWLNNGETMLVVESTEGKIYQYDYDKTSNAMTNKKTFFVSKEHFPQFVDTAPDGCVVTEDNKVVVAVHGTGCAVLLDNKGTVLNIFQVPPGSITCPEIGGADMDELFLTTGHPRHMEADFVSPPGGEADLSGALFRFKVPGLKGAKRRVWNGDVSKYL